MNENMQQFSSFNELVFDQRNKLYGAYALRQTYEKNTLMGLFIGTILIATAFLIPYLGGKKPGKYNIPVIDIMDTTMVYTLPKEQKEKPPTNSGGGGGNTIESTIPVPVDSVIMDTSKVDQPDTNIVIGPKGEGPPNGDTTGRGKGPGGPPGGGGEGSDSLVMIPDEFPEFPGGEDELMKFLASNIRYPQVAKEVGAQGKVFVSFIVDRNGQITDVTLMRGIGYGCDEEAMRVVRKMPAWKPGKMNGRPVRVKYNLPIRYVLK